MSLLIFEDVHFAYPSHEEGGQPKPVLHGIDLTIHEGEFVAVLGHNGSGKSTLAKLCNAILTPTEGRVLACGFDTREADQVLAVRQRIGMVFQNPDNQIVGTVVEEDVAFALENLGVPSDEIRRRVDEALQQVEMFDYREHAPHRLSGGQKQRVAIAGVIAMNPRCIVLDEATAMLDPLGRVEVMRTVTDLNRRHGVTVLHITHHMSEALHADRVVVMNEGRILADGTPRDIFSRVDMLHHVGLSAPPVVELMHTLRGAGWTLPEDALTLDDCAAAIRAAVPRDYSL